MFCIISGLISDSQKLIETARSEAHYHRFVYKEPLIIKSISQAVADLALNFGEGDITSKRKPISRPYGVSLLFGGIDKFGPCIYQTDPSGTLVGYLAKGIGSAEEGIQSLLDIHYKVGMSIQDGKKLALGILKQVMEDKIKPELVELFYLTNETSKFVKMNTEEIESLLKVVPDLN